MVLDSGIHRYLLLDKATGLFEVRIPLSKGGELLYGSYQTISEAVEALGEARANHHLRRYFT